MRIFRSFRAEFVLLRQFYAWQPLCICRKHKKFGSCSFPDSVFRCLHRVVFFGRYSSVMIPCFVQIFLSLTDIVVHIYLKL